MTLLSSASSTLDVESGSSTSLVQHLSEVWESPVSKMTDSIEAQYQASLKSAKDPDGEPYPAFASKKSWNEVSGKTGSGKKFYHNVISGADFAAQPSCVAEYVEPTPEVTYGHVAHPVTTRTVAHRQVPLIQRVQKMVEVPQVQSIDNVVDIPVIRQRHVSLGSSGGCAESQGEEEQEEREMGRSLSQGGGREREEDETDAQVPGRELVRVAPNMGGRWLTPPGHDGPEMGQRAARDPWDDRVSGETRKENSTSGRTWQPEGWRGWRERERAPSSKMRSAKPASKKPSLTTPKS